MTSLFSLPSFSRVSRGFEEHASEPANDSRDAARLDGRGGCDADGVVTWAALLPPPHPQIPHPRPSPEWRGEARDSLPLHGGRAWDGGWRAPLLGQEGNSFCYQLLRIFVWV